MHQLCFNTAGANEMPFTLTMLGTDTQYRPRNYLPTLESVHRIQTSETLSYMAFRIAGNPGEPCNACPATPRPDSTQDLKSLKNASDYYKRFVVPVNSNSVVIEGPDTAGTVKYSLIGLGVVELLKAISRGERQLNINGHSRGAVESIIITHELDRIKRLFNPLVIREDELLAAICASENKDTAKIMTELLAVDLVSLKTAFQATEDALKISIYALDPVPGDSVFRMTTAAWTDKRFETIPDIVNDCFQILYTDERTRAFKPIRLKAIDVEKTKLTVLPLYGHHGIGSGNPASQNGESVVPFDQTRAVQHVVMAQLFNRLKRTGVDFTEGVFDCYLDRFFNQYLSCDDKAKQAWLFDAYQHMESNRAAYSQCSKNGYVGTTWGNEFSIEQCFFSKAEHSYRPVRKSGLFGASDVPLHEVVSSNLSGLVNLEHAEISAFMLFDAVHPTIGVFQSVSPVTQICSFVSKTLELKSDDERRFVSDEAINKIKEKLLLVTTDLALVYSSNVISDEDRGSILQAVASLLRYHSPKSVEDVDSADSEVWRDINLSVDDLHDYFLEQLSGSMQELVNQKFDEIMLFGFTLMNKSDAASDNSFVFQTKEKIDDLQLSISRLYTLLDMEGSWNGYEEGLRKAVKRLEICTEILPFYCGKAIVQRKQRFPKELLSHQEFSMKVGQGLIMDQSLDYRQEITAVAGCEKDFNTQLVDIKKFGYSLMQERSEFADGDFIAETHEWILKLKAMKLSRETYLRENQTALSEEDHVHLSKQINLLNLYIVGFPFYCAKAMSRWDVVMSDEIKESLFGENVLSIMRNMTSLQSCLMLASQGENSIYPESSESDGSTELEYTKPPYCLSECSFLVLNVFIAAIGLAAVAIAFAILLTTPVIGPVVGTVGAAVCLFGLFNAYRQNSCEEIPALVPSLP